jgi:BlaI family transcriptional regulator, penicillinase repressor
MARGEEKRDQAPAPTDAELEVLRVLWDRGASTVREVHAAVCVTKPVGYTTVLKQMQVMHQKGLLRRSERFRSHVYEPNRPQTQTQRQLARTLVERAFGGSASALLQSALGGRRVTPEELTEIRQLLDQIERKSQ